MNRERVQALKRVLRDWRQAGIPDDYLAGLVRDLRDQRLAPHELDRLISDDIKAGLVVLATHLSENERGPRD